MELSENGISKHALVKPYARIRDLTDVFVVTDFEGKGEVDAGELYPPEPSSEPESTASSSASSGAESSAAEDSSPQEPSSDSENGEASPEE